MSCMDLVHGQLAPMVLQAAGRAGVSQKPEGQEAGAIQKPEKPEGQEEGPNLEEDQEGEERRTEAWRCWTGRWEQYWN